VPPGGPELELRVAAGAHLQEAVLAAVVKVDAGDGLRVAAIEALGEPQNRRQRLDGPAPLARQVREAFVLRLRRGAAMIAGDQCDGLDFVRIEPAQIAVPDQVVRVLVVALVADMDADVVEKRRIFEPLALAIGQAMDRPRFIEER